MIQISHKTLVLWKVSSTYRSIPEEEYYYLGWGGTFVLGKRRSRQQWDYLRRAYYYCTQIDVVFSGSFDEFARKMSEGLRNPYSKRSRWSSRWSRYYEDRFKRSAYRRRPEHQKKVLSEKEKARREWREFKQFSRDNARQNWVRGRKKYFTGLSNRQHRQWERQSIKHERWDLHNNEYKYFCDSWLWD